VSLLEHFYDPTGGVIEIDGQDIAGVTKASLRGQIAYVSQQPYLFEGSIRDNIRYGRPDATDAEVEEAARLAQAVDFIVQQPHGWDTMVGENGVTLSGGQRQRCRLPAPSCATRRCCCSTRRHRRSTMNPSSGCRRRWNR
jgi:subfamily B ATP-binding cassette protein MsbA